jgi:YggT family protein
VLPALDFAARAIVVVALVYAALVAVTHWAVRQRKIGPFGFWPRLVRRASDPILLPLERKVMRAGGSPQDAPLWMVGIVIAGGLLLLSLTSWLIGMSATLGAMAHSGPRVWIRLLVAAAFNLVMVAIFVRVIASWFGVSPYRPWMRPVMVLTNWIVEPVRRILPPTGMIDFSPMVAWLILWVLRGFVLGLM